MSEIVQFRGYRVGLWARAALCVGLAALAFACAGGAGLKEKSWGTGGRLSTNPTSIDFGKVAVGSTSSQDVTLSNSGDASVTISQADITGAGFSVSGLALPATLSAGSSLVISVRFSPAAAGSVTGSLTLVSDATNSPTSLALAGEGVTQALTVTPSSIAFGDVTVGSSKTQAVTLRNAGTVAVTVSQANVSGTGFSISRLSLPLSLSAGQSTTFDVTFTPATTGSVTGSVSLVSDTPGSPTVISLSGRGVTLTLTASPSSLDFGNVTVGSSGTESVQLRNTGSGNVTVSQINVTGTGFSFGGITLPRTLTAGQSTSFTVTFTPSATGSFTGSVSIVSTATNSPSIVSLAGSGVAAVAHSVDLFWTVSPSIVEGYRVYRGTKAGGPYTPLNAGLVTGTAYTDNTVQSGQTYYYVVTAVDANNVESGYSNEAEAVVPTP